MASIRSSALLLAAAAAAQRTTYLLDQGWRFQIENSTTPGTCTNASFPINMNDILCIGLSNVNAYTLNDCIDSCCSDPYCQIYQWCEGGTCTPQNSCYTGEVLTCESKPGSGWISNMRNDTGPPAPLNRTCTDPRCQVNFNDASWRLLDLPHDFVVEGNYSQNADMSHGYLPYGIGWYRKHMTVPASAQGSTLWLEFDGVQTISEVWLNGITLGSHLYGYTASRYFLNASLINFGADNVLAVRVDATKPDGWWYDGGGIYRHVWLVSIPTPSAYIAPWGVYAPGAVTGPISWSSQGAPFADGQVWPSVEVWNNATSSASFSLAITVMDASGATVATTSGGGTVAGNGGVNIWNASAAVPMKNASLWHLVAAPLKPALYTMQVVLSVGGSAVDTVTVTFGVRATRWDAATGFYLNGVATKILGMANHQDFAAVGVAVPDVLQAWRVNKLKAFGANGWRTAHNPPTPALLEACDTLGFVVWDENHRNGQYDQVPLLIKRDRNHPSVVIWSICNEVLCNTNDSVADALAMKQLMHSLDPLGNRPVSANQNGYIGPNTPLDVQGFDYSTGNYDNWHNEAPNIPSISSETSSAVSDRDEYVNDAVGGHVSGYDNVYPGWGESAEQAWGGVGMSNNQGILTRPFISGGWVWTGHDYRGEPTPYSWPDKSSHFGVTTLAGDEKDRTWWYRAWFTTPSPPSLHVFPHWNWNATVGNVDVWVFSNADSIELIVNGVSLGSQFMPQYSHVQWSVPYVPGYIQAVAYMNGSSTPVATQFRNTTGAPAQLSISIRDNVGTQMMAGCNDAALVLVQVLDAAGLVVPYAANDVTFSVTGPATYVGAHNGDPAASTMNQVSTWPAFHGLVTAVIRGGATAGTVTVTATSPGLAPVSLNIPQVTPPNGWSAFWCVTSPML